MTVAHNQVPMISRWPRRAFTRLRHALSRARHAEPLEFEQLVVRYLIGVFTTSCAVLSWWYDILAPWQLAALAVMIPVAWLIAFGFMLHFALGPERRVERRAATIIFDAVTLSLFIYFGGEAASIFFPVYLWVILGNGFRFGIGYMYASMLANGLCFALVVANTPNWQANWAFAAGVILSLLIIPLYVSRLIRELRFAMAEARAADRAKSEFLATMSHELRTPLNAIIGMSQVLDRTAQSPQDRMSATSINSAATRLLEMVDAVLHFQKVESQAVMVNTAPVDLAHLLHDVETLLRPLAQRKGLGLHIRFTTALPPRVCADKEHLKTVLLNLGGNAIKYTDTGHVWITVAHDAQRVGEELRVTVSDTGSGIPEHEHGRLFDRFAQAEQNIRSPEGGVGLGLSLCRSLVDLMGGDIGVSSKPGEGSTFWFKMPAEAAQPAASVDEPHAPPEVALLVRLQDRDRIVPSLRAHGLDAGTAIANPRDFVKARAASGDLGRYVLVVDALELDARAIEEIRHAADTAPIPPALVTTGASEELADFANARLEGQGSADAALIATVAAWHGLKPQAPVQAAEDPPDIAPLKVLVADDNPFNREVAKKLLSLDGHSVVLASTGEEALDSLLRGGIDMAFLDINMPGGDGITVCKDYRLTVEPEAHIPVIAMTADTSAPTRETCLHAGMDAVLHKPVQMNELRETIRAHQRPIQPVTVSSTTSGSREASADQTPQLDADQLDEMIDLFGADAFREDMVALFEADFERQLDALEAAITKGEHAGARDALHALKSCANTIGAIRLATICTETGEAGALPAATLPARITSEYEAFKLALYARLGRTVSTPAKPTTAHGDEAAAARHNR